jgi:hypothetical protein
VNTTSFAILAGRALTLVARHRFLYAFVAAAAMAIEWCIYRFFNRPPVIMTSGIVVSAVVDSIVFAQSKGDVDGWSGREVWARTLERLWAVVIVSFVFTFVTTYGFFLLAGGDLIDRILAIPILLIATAIIFAEAVAVVTDEDQWWFLVVRAIGTSIRTSLTGATMGRALALFGLALLPDAAVALIAPAFTHGHVPESSFWTDVPLGIVFSIPLDVLIVLAFFDASGYESNRTCGE